MKWDDPLNIQRVNLPSLGNNRRSVLHASGHNFAMEKFTRCECLPEEVEGSGHGFGVGQVEEKVAHDESLGVFVIISNFGHYSAAKWSVGDRK